MSDERDYVTVDLEASEDERRRADPAYACFAQFRSLVSDLPFAGPVSPAPPWYDSIPAGHEYDFRRIVSDYESIPNPSIGAQGVWAEIGAWTDDLNRFAHLGHHLAYALGVALGCLEDDAAFEDEHTERIEIIYTTPYDGPDTLPDETAPAGYATAAALDYPSVPPWPDERGQRSRAVLGAATAAALAVGFLALITVWPASAPDPDTEHAVIAPLPLGQGERYQCEAEPRRIRVWPGIATRPSSARTSPATTTRRTSPLRFGRDIDTVVIARKGKRPVRITVQEHAAPLADAERVRAVDLPTTAGVAIPIEGGIQLALERVE